MFHQYFSSDFFFEIPAVLEVITSFRWVKSLVLKPGGPPSPKYQGRTLMFYLIFVFSSLIYRFVDFS